MKEKASRRADLLGAFVAGALVLVFCGLLLWHDPTLFWNDDYEISILPVFADVARSWSEGHLPLLSPYSWVCSNLAGEFQYGTFSVFINAALQRDIAEFVHPRHFYFGIIGAGAFAIFYCFDLYIQPCDFREANPAASPLYEEVKFWNGICSCHCD